ncbi:hypothetical protein [Nocardia sp. NPDC006630]|uniref:hypothetical protein n=1 Tax=Nocardia sp. NPDC006630 TaxID=3157181 RepID=UPI0033AE00E6
MTDLLAQSQIRILARALGADPAELTAFESLDAADLRALHERVSDFLCDSQAETFGRVSRLATLVPDALAAKVALSAIPAEVAGRAGGPLSTDHPQRVAGVLRGLTPGYLADAAPFLDRRATAALTRLLPVSILVPTALELMRRRDHLTASLFVEHSTDEQISGYESGIDDDAGLLQTIALIWPPDRLNHTVRLISEVRRHRIVGTAADGGPEVVAATLSLLSRLDADHANLLGNKLFAALDAAQFERIVAVAAARNAWRELLGVLTALNDSVLTALATHPALTAEPTLSALSAAADTARTRSTVAIVRTQMAGNLGSAEYAGNA